jgi:hypothetical protein
MPLASATARRRPNVLSPAEWVMVGLEAGLLAGILMTLPLLIWDWVKPSHVALEYPTAAAAWLFGLDHFSHVTYRFWPIVLGFTFLALYWILSGIAFTGIADRLYGLTSVGKSLVAGAVWGVVSFVLFWYVLLPIARDGSPFRATARAPDLFVAPNWVWIVSFCVFGLALGGLYARLRPDTVAVEGDLNGR